MLSETFADFARLPLTPIEKQGECVVVALRFYDIVQYFRNPRAKEIEPNA